MFHQHSPEAATWFNILNLNNRIQGFLLFRAFLKKMGTSQNEQFLLAIVILDIYMVLLKGILFVLTGKNKGSFVNIYEGG